ncbi:DUF4174 domain-containing protein [Gramella lutea]|uniref:DUF4174 domain-containing protein n=1 Tax=Christiangramia lutea TaxID=1607951 RepID=A0A9X2A8T0_9FLAO|nr:DUF4174 domain-containing protein [Christiangramia lutea]MCH4822655.1 DUF4174 domain-containing protein [Christiangramia lutea]
MKPFIIFAFLLISPIAMLSQSLSEYKWQNRLLVIFTESENSSELQKQVQIFDKKKNELEDRKLKVIHSVPGKYQVIFPEKSTWKNSNLYEKMEISEAGFEIILIGLDGTVKLRQPELLKTKKLFSLIDSMPMRQAEIRNGN